MTGIFRYTIWLYLYLENARNPSVRTIFCTTYLTQDGLPISMLYSIRTKSVVGGVVAFAFAFAPRPLPFLVDLSCRNTSARYVVTRAASYSPAPTCSHRRFTCIRSGACVRRKKSTPLFPRRN